jgi:hypothetical protein
MTELTGRSIMTRAIRVGQAMPIDECFRILEVPPTASADEVLASYRTLVAVWHPNRFLSNAKLRTEAERKLKTINEAFDTLAVARLTGARMTPPAGRVRSEPAPLISMPAEPSTPEAPKRALPSVPATFRVTVIAVVASVFGLAVPGEPLTDHVLASLLIGVLAGLLLSDILLHVVWSFQTRPRTSIGVLGACATLGAWCVARVPYVGVLLGVFAVLAGPFLTAVVFRLRAGFE